MAKVYKCYKCGYQETRSNTPESAPRCPLCLKGLLVVEPEYSAARRKFKFHWLDGTSSVAKGADVKEAFQNAGFGQGALKALDYFEEL